MLKPFLWVLLACLLALSIPAFSSTSVPVENQDGTVEEASEGKTEAEGQGSFLDRHKEYVDTQVTYWQFVTVNAPAGTGFIAK